MIKTFILLWCENKLLVTGFVLALTITVFFAVRSVAFWIYWADPAHRNQPIQAWMTPRYVAHSWHVPPEIVAQALGLEPGSGRITLGELAKMQGLTIEQLVEKLRAEIIAFRTEKENKRK